MHQTKIDEGGIVAVFAVLVLVLIWYFVVYRKNKCAKDSDCTKANESCSIKSGSKSGYCKKVPCTAASDCTGSQTCTKGYCA